MAHPRHLENRIGSPPNDWFLMHPPAQKSPRLRITAAFDLLD
jgi:hypothetical protein